ncbi:MAG: hypothetical protein NPMRD1_250021, partial [Nitrosopumilales archaeon]
MFWGFHSTEGIFVPPVSKAPS